MKPKFLIVGRTLYTKNRAAMSIFWIVSNQLRVLFGANLGYLAQSLQEIVNHLRITMDIINDLENCDTHLEKRPLYCHLVLKIVVLGPTVAYVDWRRPLR